MFKPRRDASRKEVVFTCKLDETAEIDSPERRVNQYKITRILGEGSYGTVLYGRDRKGNEYALKEISKSRVARKNRTFPSLGQLPKANNNIENPVKAEIDILKNLNHPNVIQLFEVIEDPENDLMFLVLEYCKKGVSMTISMENATKPLTERNTWLWFRQLVSAVYYLHQNNTCHRDIKPDNLLITGANELKIIDFGVSHVLNCNMELNRSAGSPAFIAPELLQGTINENMLKMADVWAIGVTFYCFIYGKLPFTGESILELNESIKTKTPEISPRINPLLRELLLGLLEKDPTKRLNLEDVIVHPWTTKNRKSPLLPTNNIKSTDTSNGKNGMEILKSTVINEAETSPKISCCFFRK